MLDKSVSLHLFPLTEGMGEGLREDGKVALPPCADVEHKQLESPHVLISVLDDKIVCMW